MILIRNTVAGGKFSTTVATAFWLVVTTLVILARVDAETDTFEISISGLRELDQTFEQIKSQGISSWASDRINSAAREFVPTVFGDSGEGVFAAGEHTYQIQSRAMSTIETMLHGDSYAAVQQADDEFWSWLQKDELPALSKDALPDGVRGVVNSAGRIYDNAAWLADQADGAFEAAASVTERVQSYFSDTAQYGLEPESTDIKLVSALHDAENIPTRPNEDRLAAAVQWEAENPRGSIDNLYSQGNEADEIPPDDTRTGDSGVALPTPDERSNGTFVQQQMAAEGRALANGSMEGEQDRDIAPSYEVTLPDNEPQMAASGGGTANGSLKVKQDPDIAPSYEEMSSLPNDEDVTGTSCRFFTRPTVERADGIARLNYYAEGSEVCHGENRYICEKKRWRKRGNSCSADDTKQAWRVEGSTPEPASASTQAGDQENERSAQLPSSPYDSTSPFDVESPFNVPSPYGPPSSVRGQSRFATGSIYGRNGSGYGSSETGARLAESDACNDPRFQQRVKFEMNRCESRQQQATRSICLISREFAHCMEKVAAVAAACPQISSAARNMALQARSNAQLVCTPAASQSPSSRGSEASDCWEKYGARCDSSNPGEAMGEPLPTPSSQHAPEMTLGAPEMILGAPTITTASDGRLTVPHSSSHA